MYLAKNGELVAVLYYNHSVLTSKICEEFYFSYILPSPCCCPSLYLDVRFFQFTNAKAVISYLILMMVFAKIINLTLFATTIPVMHRIKYYSKFLMIFQSTYFLYFL